MFQTIANQLPRAEFGWGDPPGVVELSASVKAEGPPPERPPLLATERGFRIYYAVYRDSSLWIPYTALRDVWVEWKVVPNAFLAPLLVVPLQVTRLGVVVDVSEIPGFAPQLQADLARLEAVSREVGLGGPAAHAASVRQVLADDEAEFGPDHVALYFDYALPIPAWLPADGPAREAGEAFVWAREHPDAELVPDPDAREQAAADAE